MPLKCTKCGCEVGLMGCSNEDCGGVKMNPKILEILPRYKFDYYRKDSFDSGYRIGYDKALDEVTEALKKNEVCVCPRTTELNILLQRLAQSDCGSNSCLFAGRGKGGMRTNGGCTCYKNTSEAIRKLILEGV